MNRVGDMFLSIGFFAIFWLFGNIDYATVFSIAPYMNETAITIIGLLLLFAAMGKSAQLGLNTWLPHSMEGQNYIVKENLIFILFIVFIIILCLTEPFRTVGFFFISISYSSNSVKDTTANLRSNDR